MRSGVKMGLMRKRKRKKVKKPSLLSKILMVIGGVSVVDLMIYELYRREGYTHLQALAGTLEIGSIIGLAALVLIVFLIIKK